MPRKENILTLQKSMKNHGMSATPPHPLAWAITGNHVYPINDLRKHSLRDCWCRPFDDEGVTVHNSLDGREQYERGERKLS
ncbi:MAG: hypothetical protein ACLPWF_30065 [Bryobacteraceae bacterium]|jgi:hypothetical protein